MNSIHTLTLQRGCWAQHPDLPFFFLFFFPFLSPNLRMVIKGAFEGIRNEIWGGDKPSFRWKHPRAYIFWEEKLEEGN